MTFTRRAFLIEASRVKDLDDLPGARVDIANWKAFLQSDIGGAWEDNDGELLILHNPSWIDLQTCLHSSSDIDYVFIAFSGHGYLPRGADFDASTIILNDTDSVAIQMLNPRNPRCTLVVDACREIEQPDLLLEKARRRDMIKSAVESNRKRYRELFDRAVQRCPAGMVTLLSCDANEAAGESPVTGGYFSTALMNSCINWNDQTEPGRNDYYPLNLAYQKAAEQTTNRSYQQHPKYFPGRRIHHFPLAVKP